MCRDRERRPAHDEAALGQRRQLRTPLELAASDGERCCRGAIADQPGAEIVERLQHLGLIQGVELVEPEIETRAARHQADQRAAAIDRRERQIGAVIIWRGGQRLGGNVERGGDRGDGVGADLFAAFDPLHRRDAAPRQGGEVFLCQRAGGAQRFDSVGGGLHQRRSNHSGVSVSMRFHRAVAAHQATSEILQRLRNRGHSRASEDSRVTTHGQSDVRQPPGRHLV